MSSYEGIDRAKRLGFAGPNLALANVVFTGLLTTVLDRLYTTDHRALLLTILRHPVDRAVSTYYYLQNADWELSYQPEWKNITLMQYAMRGDRDLIENNWIVRFLVNKPQLHREPLQQDDLLKAKAILREKVWIGLTSEMDETLDRFGTLLGWNRPPLSGNKWNECLDWMKSRGGGSNRNSHRYGKLEPHRAEYKKLAEINHWDMQLYEYAVQLFHQQGQQHFAHLAQPQQQQQQQQQQQAVSLETVETITA